MRRCLPFAMFLASALGSPANAASLPVVSSGQAPGPPLLYASPPATSPLTVASPFAAPPLLVSGTDAYRDGEYLYQDYLFDDRGADTVPGPGPRSDNGRNASGPTAGDVFYPTAERYGSNAADLVEFRIKPTQEAILYRVTLNTARAADATVVGIGIDTDRSGGAAVAWPGGAGISSPGLDRFITAWGSGGTVTAFPGGQATALPAGSVSFDLDTNQMTIRVPRSVMDPGVSTWHYVAGVGLSAGTGWKPVPAGVQPGAEQAASGNPLVDAPAVYNLAFRFDEPQAKNVAPPYDTFPGTGNWFEDKQASALSGRTSGEFHADVDFSALQGRADKWLHGPGRMQARVFASHFQPYEGVRQSFPGYGTTLQPYTVVVPKSYAPAEPAGLTLALHAGNSTYTQYAVSTPNLYAQLGDQRDSLVLTPFARGPDSVYTAAGEADVFEAWADVARHFTLDPDSVALAGYSMGGYGAYRLAVHNPDLFGRVFTGVGLPANQGWAPPLPPEPGGQVSNTNPMLENLRWTPIMQWAQVTDELNPYSGVRAQQERLTALGLRSRLWTFTSGDHFLLALQDEWAGARDFLGSARVTRDPSRVDYAFLPQADAPEFGLRADHAYWVSGLKARNTSGDPQTSPARAEISVRSRAFGQGDPVTSSVVEPGTGSGPPMPTSVEGVDWLRIPRISVGNALELRLENIAAACIDGKRARLDGHHVLRVSLTSDGAGAIHLRLPLPGGATVVLVAGGGPGWGASASTRGVKFTTDSGTATYEVRPGG
jgi:predicted esterase